MSAAPLPYETHHIRVLPWRDAVRTRPAMYVGSSGPQGAAHLVHEILQNSVDEALAGAATEIWLRLLPGGAVEVEDDGRGVPLEPVPGLDRSALDVVLTTLHAGGKFDQRSYAVAGGLHGVGLSVVNALSSTMEVEVRRGGRRALARCAQGALLGPLEELPSDGGRGTRVRFTPDAAIFGAVRLDPAALERRLMEQAFLLPGLRLHLDDQVGGPSRSFCFDTGVVGFVRALAAERRLLHSQPLHIVGEHAGHRVELALAWTDAWAEETLSYVNSIFTRDGGAHVDGLHRAILGAVQGLAVADARVHAEAELGVDGFDVREGLTCVLSVQMTAPEYEGQTKALLTSASAAAAVEAVVAPALKALLEADPGLADVVVGKAVEAARARAAARRAAERARYQSVDAVFSKEVYQQQFGVRSKNWHQSARWITDQDILGAHAAAFTGPSDALLLDVCCGSGVVGASFRGKVGRIIGLDLTPEMIRMAETRLDEVVQGDVYDLPFADASFDAVCNREVLHLLPRPERPVAQVYRVLKPGGQFIVGQLLPYGPADTPWFFRVLKKKQPLFFNNFTEDDMRALLTGAGFVDLEVTEVLAWEDIDTWIDTWETPALERAEIRALYTRAPAEVRRAHPFEIDANGRILDKWRWLIFSCRKPA